MARRNQEQIIPGSPEHTNPEHPNPEDQGGKHTVEGDGFGGGDGNHGDLGGAGSDGEESEEELEDESEHDCENSESNRDLDVETSIEDDEDDEGKEDEEDIMDWIPNSPKNPPHPQSPRPDPRIEDVPEEEAEPIILERVVDQYGNECYIEEYPSKTAGEPTHLATPDDKSLNGSYPDVGDLAKLDIFKLVQILVDSGMSGKIRNKCLQCRQAKGTLPYKNNRKLIKAVDKLLHGPDWMVQAVKITGDLGEEIIELWMHNTLEIQKKLLRSKQLGKFIKYKAYKKWMSPERTEQIRDEIYTSDWMWEIQVLGKNPGQDRNDHPNYYFVGQD
ncbi:hypothetical protein FRC08_011529 [Ceratobasidium sp. 394]|nr:hypothetical protein FRC08_011529 [Ceratobasidium sp. 394]